MCLHADFCGQVAALCGRLHELVNRLDGNGLTFIGAVTTTVNSRLQAFKCLFGTSRMCGKCIYRGEMSIWIEAVPKACVINYGEFALGGCRAIRSFRFQHSYFAPLACGLVGCVAGRDGWIVVGYDIFR